MEKPLAWCRSAVLPLSLFLLVFGTKLAVIDRYGSDMPFWDQWAKEGELLYAPWFERGELWHNLFLPHSEHRMAPTLALNLGLVVAGGQWDARTQCVADAALDAAIAVGLFVWARRRLGALWGHAMFALLLLLFGPPLVWDNVLGGFQSQFYFLVGFSLLAMNGLIARAVFSGGWFLGLAAGLAAGVSMGSGFLCFVPVAAVSLLRTLRRGAPVRRAWVTLAVCIGVVGVAWIFRAHAPWHEPMHAQTPRDFLLYSYHCLSWPAPEWPWLAAVLWLPFLWAAFRWIRSGASEGDGSFIMAGGAWVLLQIAAISYSRGADGGLPASRYGSVLMVGVIFAFMSVAWLGRDKVRKLAHVYGLLALLVIAAAAIHSTYRALHNEIPERTRLYRDCERNVKAYVATGDMRHLDQQRIPFPDAKWLARILDEPTLRRLLPASINATSEMSGLSRFSEGLAKAGRYVVLLGALLMVAAALASFPRRSSRPA